MGEMSGVETRTYTGGGAERIGGRDWSMEKNDARAYTEEGKIEKRPNIGPL